MSSGSSDFPDLVTEQTVSFGALDLHRVVMLPAAADAATFFMCEASRSGATGPDFRTWHACAYAMAAERAAGLYGTVPGPCDRSADQAGPRLISLRTARWELRTYPTHFARRSRCCGPHPKVPRSTTRSSLSLIGKTSKPETASSAVFRDGSASTGCDLRRCSVGVADYAGGVVVAARACRCDRLL